MEFKYALEKRFDFVSTGNKNLWIHSLRNEWIMIDQRDINLDRWYLPTNIVGDIPKTSPLSHFFFRDTEETFVNIP